MIFPTPTNKAIIILDELAIIFPAGLVPVLTTLAGVISDGLISDISSWISWTNF